jgi:NodT family efflux transporter outer membrane factor (OMF) lipoprotein
MSRLHSIAAAASLSALAACTTVGPNYRLPPKAKVSAPEAQGRFVESSAAVSPAPVPDDWWRLYDDPVLNRLIRQALAANTDLRVAAANLEKTRAAVVEAKAERDVTLSTTANAGPAQLSQEQFLSPVPIPVSALASLAVSVSYDLDVVGRLRRTIEAAKADRDATAAALDLARVTVAADTAAAYVDACSAGDELETAERTVELQRRFLEVTQKLIAAGKSSTIDATRARALLNQSLAAVPPLEARRRAALYRLATLTGNPPADFPREVATCTRVPRVSGAIPVGDGAALLRRRPDVREAERTLAASVARIGVATADLYPDVTLGAGAGSTGLLTDIGKASTFFWNVGPAINWTYPNRGARARVRAAGANADAALARFDGVVLTALRETETALAVYSRDLERNAELRAARDEAVTAVDEAQALRRAGRSPYLTGLDAERTLATAQAALSASEGQIGADQVKLFLALGGGWRGAPTVERSPAAPTPGADRPPHAATATKP